MTEHLDPSSATYSEASIQPRAHSPDALRLLSRSPHPYHLQNRELLESVDDYPPPPSLAVAADPCRTLFPDNSRESTPVSDSGTEADDEHFLKGLPAPKRLHKGLRGQNEVLSGTSTPQPSPSVLEEEGRQFLSGSKRDVASGPVSEKPAEKLKRRKEVLRRLTELLVIVFVGALVQSNHRVRPVMRRWSKESFVGVGLLTSLTLLYPLRLIIWAYWHRGPARTIPISILSAFDPAPLFYPPIIPILVSLLISTDNEAVFLPNIVLAICSLPAVLFPTFAVADWGGNPVHWMLSCLPFLLSTHSSSLPPVGTSLESSPASLSLETATLLYPIHYNLCLALQGLTSTSLLPAELQLLAVALTNLLFLSSSPQATILKAIVWTGGLDILVSCSQTIAWGVALARVPKWRFKRPVNPDKRRHAFWSDMVLWRKIRHDLFHAPTDISSCGSCEGMEDPEESDDASVRAPKGLLRQKTLTFDFTDPKAPNGTPSLRTTTNQELGFGAVGDNIGSAPKRRHTMTSIGKPARQPYTHTPSGRRKRSASLSVQPFFTLTQRQATIRKWAYAIYVYVCIIATILVPFHYIGVKDIVQREALYGYEPVGWALGYLLGDLPWFRWQVVTHNLERWICLPSRPPHYEDDMIFIGWVERLRQFHFGQANTRLLLSVYCITVIAAGLIVVFRLSPFYEVDTRRKVFHFMMVAMFLPAVYIDPTFVSLALSIILALFLLLDLLRASQLPPLSKPLAAFLAPYVDGRDLRGPVVISHIFLLIGCAIPLWLSLGSLPRTGTGYLRGWSIPTREVSMVSGIVCVGLGDAAASLIGRRYGHRKWFWGGGKSLEGSAAFATAVFVGLLAASFWLRIGGWPTSTNPDGSADPWGTTLWKTGVCATVGSLTEAVLTGGNDNVVVPVTLWTCVKGLGV